MKALIPLYVKIQLPKSKEEILIQLDDIELTILELLEGLKANFSYTNDFKYIEEIELIKEHKKLFCWNRECNLNSKFENLLSKIEIIDQKEADVFYIKLN
ncbi:MAG: hypothetical protein ACP6IY_04655 [Promethearchaeia archaeon]